MQLFPHAAAPRTKPRFMHTLLPLALGAVLMAALGYRLLVEPRLLDSQDTGRALFHEARMALEVVTRDVRMAGYNPTGASFDGLLTTATTLQVKADLNGNGATNDTAEDIRYLYDATAQRLVRMEGSRQEVLAEHVQHFAATGLDQSGQPTTVSAQIRQLRLTVQTGNSQPGTPQSYRLTTLVNVRNISPFIEHGRG